VRRGPLRGRAHGRPRRARAAAPRERPGARRYARGAGHLRPRAAAGRVARRGAASEEEARGAGRCGWRWSRRAWTSAPRRRRPPCPAERQADESARAARTFRCQWRRASDPRGGLWRGQVTAVGELALVEWSRGVLRPVLRRANPSDLVCPSRLSRLTGKGDAPFLKSSRAGAKRSQNGVHC